MLDKDVWFCAQVFVSVWGYEGGYPRTGFLLAELRNELAIHSAGLADDLVGV